MSRKVEEPQRGEYCRLREELAKLMKQSSGGCDQDNERGGSNGMHFLA